jgi:hypothetical protein
MGSYAFPLNSARELAERLDDFPPGAHARRWVIRDDNDQHYHGVVRLDEDPLFLDLQWKPDAHGREQRVGLFRLHLAELLRAGYVRREGEDPNGAEIRLRFCRADRGVVLIQSRDDAPGLPVGMVDRAFG